MTAQQKIIRHLDDAHALEAALVQTLTAHVAMTPPGAYCSLLERHLDETRGHADRIRRRRDELSEGGRSPIELAYEIAQAALGQLAAATKLPVDLLRRGLRGEEKLLDNARDEVASEGLEIATYDALEALAEAAGDEATASLAREHRAEEEAFLRDLRELIPQLARDALQAETEDAGPFEATETGGLDAARAAAAAVREKVAGDVGGGTASATAAAGGASEAPGTGAPEEAAGAAEPLPIPDYDELPVARIIPKLRLLTVEELERVEAYERAHRNRRTILDRVRRLRSATDGRAPAARR